MNTENTPQENSTDSPPASAADALTQKALDQQEVEAEENEMMEMLKDIQHSIIGLENLVEGVLNLLAPKKKKKPAKKAKKKVSRK